MAKTEQELRREGFSNEAIDKLVSIRQSVNGGYYHRDDTIGPLLEPTPKLKFAAYLYRHGVIGERGQSNAIVPKNLPLSYLRAQGISVPEHIIWEIPEGLKELLPQPAPELLRKIMP